MLRRKKTAADLNSRRAVLWVHPQAILAFMTSERWVIVNGHLPSDVTYHSVFWDPMRNVWGVVCQSQSFKPVKLNQEMPVLPPVEFKNYNAGRDGVIA